jgi:hypothetical protein
MTPEELEQMRADMAAGTPGPWGAIIGKYGWQIHAKSYWLANLKCESCPAHEEANARRIARVPTLEAEVLRLTEANAALAEELARVRQVLAEIAERHIPDQPAAYGGDEAEWAVRQHTELRRIARAALSHTGMTGQRGGV